METMADRPGLPDQHRPKRKRVASTQPSDASHGVRPRATRTRTDTSGFVRNVSSQLQQAQSANGAHYSWPVNPGPGVTETVGSGPTALEPSCDANLQSFQTHRDTRLHSARALAQASHHHNSMQPVQPCMPYPVAAQSSGHDGPHAVPIAGHRQDPGENGFATAALLESHNSAAGALLYDPSFQHHISALIPGQLREAGVHQHQPPPSSPPPLDPAQTVAPYTAPSAASVYYGDLLPQQVQIAGPGHNINSGTAASTEACVTDCVQVTHLTRTDHLPASGQGSGVGEHSLHYQPQTALPPTSYANQALISHSQASPVHNGFPSDAGQQITDFEHSSGALGRYGAYPFDFHPPSQPQPTMGGGDTYPVHQQLGGDGSSLLVPEQPHLPQLTSQGGTAHENMPSGHDVALCGPQVSTYPVSYPAAPSQGTFGQNGWPEQEPPEKPEDQRSLPYGLANPDPASNTNSGSSVLELDGTARKTKKRSAFDEVRRRETADTRSRKACLRCRIQKGRCEVDPRNAEAECLKCQNYSKDSKKTIHHIPCYRNKLTDTVLFRKGGLKLTTRWDGTAMKDVGDRIDPHDVRTIHFTLGVCDQPLVIEVVRFNARPGDVTARYWIVREGIHGDEVRKKKELEPYCLANIWTTGNYFEKYIIDNAIPSIIKQNTPLAKLRGLPLAAPDVIQRTYTMAVEHYLGLEDDVEGPDGKKPSQEKALLSNLFILWFAIRHTTGSAYICGEEKLGMKPEIKDETYPLYGKVSLPRMILAQFDSINSTKLLSKYAHRVLTGLEIYMTSSQSRWWWTTYLCVFILLREASFISADRYRHARNNHGAKLRYSIPKFVEELQAGCNNILMHWHYYNRGPWPDPHEPLARHKHFMGELSSEQHKLVMDTLVDPLVSGQLAVWKECRENNGHMKRLDGFPGAGSDTPYYGSQAQLDWDHPLYWVSQIFEEMWRPHRTYEREYES